MVPGRSQYPSHTDRLTSTSYSLTEEAGFEVMDDRHTVNLAAWSNVLARRPLHLLWYFDR